MPSSVIKRFEYRQEQLALDVDFITGRRYRYHEVPEAEADGLKAAFSKGVYFNQNIRDRYRYTREG